MKSNKAKPLIVFRRCCFKALLVFPLFLPIGLSQTLNHSAGKSVTQQTDKDYRLGPGDVLLINVKGLKEFDRKYYVSNSGKIHIPYLGTLPVNDLTPAQLQADIVKRLREKNLLKEPIWVDVGVTESRAHSVYLLGEVMQPGQFAIKGDYHISDLIFQGVGFNEVRSRYGYLYRRECQARNAPGKDSTKEPGQEECVLG
ncbi:MAG: polysaccharide biosynthesis/export family protein, partial [Terriglobia bacterium]